MNLKSLFSLDANIVINRALARSWGLDAAAMFSYLVQVEPEPGGWFGITQAELSEATTLTPWQTRAALDVLEAHKAIGRRITGLPARTQYRISEENILKNPQFVVYHKQVCGFRTTGKNPENPGTCAPASVLVSHPMISPSGENSDNLLIKQVLISEKEDKEETKEKGIQKEKKEETEEEYKSLMLLKSTDNGTHTDINSTQTQLTSTHITKSPINPRKKITYNTHFDEETAKIVGIPHGTLARWREKYKCDIDRQIGYAEEWVASNPANRKQNYLRFLTNWLTRADKTHPEKQREPEYIDAAARMRQVLGIA